MKEMLKNGQVHNNPVTPKDVDNAEKIFGPDIPSLKGRTTRKKPDVVRENVVAVPDDITHQGQDLTLFMDVMFIQGQPVLMAIDDVFKYRMVSWMVDRTIKEFYKAINVFTRKYNMQCNATQ